MKNRGGKRHYESALYFIIACVAIVVFYFWVVRLVEPVEEAGIQRTLLNLRAAVQITELTAIAAGEPERLARLDKTNPFELLDSPGSVYAGELKGAAGPTRPGRWYFDPADGELLYRVIKAGPEQRAFRRFQLRYRPADNRGGSPGRLRLAESTGQGDRNE